MIKLSLLEKKQILEIFKNSNAKASITDFAILLGGYVSNDSYTIEGYNLMNRAGYYWTQNTNNNEYAYVIDSNGAEDWINTNSRDCGGRPVIPLSQISKIASNKTVDQDGNVEIDCFYYPGKVAPVAHQIYLESLYQHNYLLTKDNYYTTDSKKYNDYNSHFSATSYNEYEHDGKRYIRVKANSCFDRFTLSNRETYHNNNFVWVEVNPLKWIIDEKTGIAISKNIIFAGVSFLDINKFMNEYLAKNLEQSINYSSNEKKEPPYTYTKRMK